MFIGGSCQTLKSRTQPPCDERVPKLPSAQ